MKLKTFINQNEININKAKNKFIDDTYESMNGIMQVYFQNLQRLISNLKVQDLNDIKITELTDSLKKDKYLNNYDKQRDEADLEYIKAELLILTIKAEKLEKDLARVYKTIDDAK